MRPASRLATASPRRPDAAHDASNETVHILETASHAQKMRASRARARLFVVVVLVGWNCQNGDEHDADDAAAAAGREPVRYGGYL